MTEDERNFGRMLIERGISPKNKKYEKVRPRGLYILLPSMWRQAKQMEQMHDHTFDILMNQYQLANSKYELAQRLSKTEADDV